MLYTSAAEPFVLLQEGLSQALIDGELSADEFKTFELTCNDFLRFVNLEIQKAPGDGIAQIQQKSLNCPIIFLY